MKKKFVRNVSNSRHVDHGAVDARLTEFDSLFELASTEVVGDSRYNDAAEISVRIYQ